MKRSTLLICLGLITLNSVFSQSRCVPLQKTQSGEEAILIADEMPEPNMDNSELADLLNSQIDLSKYDLEPLQQVFFYVTINCKGEAFDFQMPRGIDSELDKEILGVVKSNMSWKPGLFQDEPIDVVIAERLHIVEGRFKYLTEKQLKRARKKIE